MSKKKTYNSTKLIKLKSSVWVIISIFRINRFMTENLKLIPKSQSLSNTNIYGINLKAHKALITRNKISNNN